MLMLFIKTSNFTKLLPKYLTDEEYSALQVYPLMRPEAGDIVRGSGGVRVIYYFKRSQHQIWMLTLYQKSEQATIPSHLLKKIAEALKND